MPTDDQEKPVWVWLDGQPHPVLAGTYQVGGGTRPLGRLRYSPDYLAREDAFALDPLNLPLARRHAEKQYTTLLNKGLFGVLRDVCPEGYGRGMLNLKYGRQDGPELAPLQLLELSAGDSVGAVEVCDDIERKIRYRAPDAQALIDLLEGLAPERHASHAIHQLEDVGTSMGGMRPKITVQHEGVYYLAKLQERGDIPHTPAREYVTMSLAHDSRLYPAGIKLHRCKNGRELLLVRRFDRAGVDGQRLPFMSAHTLLRLDLASIPGDPARSYLSLADQARRLGVPAGDIATLWHRMAFNALVNNTDDHPRNHGFLQRDGQWRLSPAFDITPTFSASPHDGPVQAMSVSADGSAHATIEALLRSATHFGVPPDAAARWLTSTAESIAQSWRPRMERAGIEGQFLDRQGESFRFAESVADRGGYTADYAAQLQDQASSKRRARRVVTMPKHPFGSRP